MLRIHSCLTIGLCYSIMKTTLDEASARQLNFLGIKLLPLCEFIATKNQRVKLQFLLLKILEAITHRILHNVEQNIIWVGIFKPLTDQK